MKKISTLLLFLSFLNGFSQSLSNRKIAELNKLNIQTETLDLKDINVQTNLNNILCLDKKRRKNKTVGVVLTSLSVTSLILGGALLSKDNGISDALGGIMFAGGAVYGGISIPFWNSAKKRKTERDKLIEMYHK